MHVATSSRTLLAWSLLASLSAAAASILARLAWGLHPLPELAMSRIVQLLPPAWFEEGIRLLGGNAKPELFFGLLALELVVLTVLGYCWLRRGRRYPLAVLLVLVLVLYLLAAGVLLPLLGLGFFGAQAPLGQIPSAAGPLLTYAVWGAGLWTARRLLDAGEAPDESRRRLVLASGVWAMLATSSLAGGIWALLQRTTITQLAQRPNRTPPITPTSDFYIVSKNVLDPQIDPETWRLRVDGNVERPLTFTLDELRGLPVSEQLATMECISNPVGGRLMSTADWKGVRLSELLNRARLKPGSYDVVTMCRDGYSESLEVERAMSPDVLLVYEMNGSPLVLKHGAPLRLQVPGLYGLKSSKWVERIRVVDYDYKGYWQKESGWTDLGVVHYTTRIDYPPDGMVPREGMLLTGVAYTGVQGVSKVEVSMDGGTTWSEAALEPPLGRLTWRLWSYRWHPPSPGFYQVMARTYDLEDNPQEESPVVRPGGSFGGPKEGVVIDGAVGIQKVNLTVAKE